MKNIPHLKLSLFKGTTIKDPDMILFEFDITCNSYDYQSDVQIVNLFLATYKDDAL